MKKFDEMKSAAMNIVKGFALWVVILAIAAWNFDCSEERFSNRVSVSFLQSIVSESLYGFDYVRVMKVNGETGQNELFREVEMNGRTSMDLHLEMPGTYIIESSTKGIKNEDATLCFDEEWVQTCLALGKAKLRNKYSARTTFEGSVVPRSSIPVLYEADMLQF